MCFSANASFITAASLCVVGVATMRKVREGNQYPLASIPFIFSIQQFCEGFLWLSHTHIGYAGVDKWSTFLFLLFAQVIWPVWVPFSFYMFEKNKIRRKYLFVFLYFGFVTAAYLGFSLLNFPYKASIDTFHIHYELSFPDQHVFMLQLFYFISIVFPPLCSSRKLVFATGAVLLLSFVVSMFLFGEYLISVWCYFAAIVSLLIYFVIKEEPELHFVPKKLSVIREKFRG